MTLSENTKRRKLAQIGQARSVDSAPTIRRIRALHDIGMTTALIAERAGIAQSTVSDLNTGHRGRRNGGRPIVRIPRTTQDAIFRVQPDYSFQWTSKALVDGTGTRRRIQALHAQGFSYRWIAQELDVGDWAMVFELATQEERKVQVRTRARVKALYDKLDGVDPVDAGMHPQAASRSRGLARRYRYAGRACWDDDTLDDPSAIPEWTGACGTPVGYRIHLREMIPVCEPCLKSRRLQRMVEGVRTGVGDGSRDSGEGGGDNGEEGETE